ncbi:peptidase domain-containing ABC transporter [Mucilaginibacter sp. SMC90]|uniref:peptidase domain-containing ABC transporter n=1 Tax=Mucilaginibacter sp. SMC90 TaxID=2929803 RepID=UPI001FB44890|nr:peptidase domain-containing ABC transporter [Mucilaginibacter sp. SMC90]UOE50918.1 peptidase domain-containing ABC transporter [Mucilaginibacter sp. SMC90]
MLRSFPTDRQLDMMDCGPSCLKIIAKYYGKYYSLQHLRDKCGVSREGVSFLDLSYAGDSIGLRSLATSSSIDDLIYKVPLPAIIHWDNSHFVVVYKISAKKVYLSDPAKGLVSYPVRDLERYWYDESGARGSVLILEPQADFKQREAGDRIERKKTIENIIAYFIPYKRSFLNVFVVMLVATLLQAFLPFISKAVIDIGIHTNDLHFINIVLIANITIILCMTLSNAVRDWILLHVTSRINIALISDYLIKIMRLPVTFFENKMVGDILQRANDNERIRSFITNNSLNLLFSGLTFLIFSIILLIYNGIMFSIFFAGSVLYIFWVLAFMKIRKKIDWEYFSLVSKNQSFWVETVSAITDIKLNNYETKKRWRWEKIQAQIFKLNQKTQAISNWQSSGAQCIDSLKNLLITFFAARAVIAGDITFGVMISTQFIIGMLSGPINQFVSFIISAQYAQISFLRLNEVHQIPDEEEDEKLNDIQLPLNKSLVLKNLSFQYHHHGTLILKNINLIIPEGKVTAIVGDSGSGKSTLLKILLRLYKPSYGELCIGDMNLNTLSLRNWRNVCGAVMQDGKIFSDTILNNIVLEDEKIDFERLKQAVSAANIATEIEQLPLGYNTVMGEMGRGLSGGQKQRILIARALYKNPDFLFFDEATNALDAINEQKIVQALDNVFKGKTVIVVAHRLSTIRKADQIVVLKDGSVMETGNHETLMRHRGHYFNLIQSQFDNGMENQPVTNPAVKTASLERLSDLL